MELNNRVIIAQLKSALASGTATTRGGTLDVSVIQLTSLDTAIARADELGCHTDEARLLLHTARTMRALRSALLHDDLPGMVAVLDEVRGGTLSELVHHELETILKEFDERAIIAELTRALSRGGPTGEPGSLSLAAISLPEIDAGIGYALQLGTKSAATEQLVYSAQVIRRLRQALAAHDWAVVRQELEAAERDGGLAAAAMDEVTRVRNHVALREMLSTLRSALTSGMALEKHGCVLCCLYVCGRVCACVCGKGDVYCFL